MALLSLRAYAEHRKVTEGAVRKAIASGRISTTADGKIDPAIADRQWAMNTNPAQAQSDRGDSKAASSFQISRAQKEIYEALLKKLEYEKLSGALIPLKQTEMEAYTAARFARDKLLKIPDRIAPALVGKTDINEIKEILRKEIRQSLENLVDFLNGPES